MGAPLEPRWRQLGGALGSTKDDFEKDVGSHRGTLSNVFGILVDLVRSCVEEAGIRSPRQMSCASSFKNGFDIISQKLQKKTQQTNECLMSSRAEASESSVEKFRMVSGALLHPPQTLPTSAWVATSQMFTQGHSLNCLSFAYYCITGMSS